MSRHFDLARTADLAGLRALTVAALALLGGAVSCGGLGECQPGQPCEVRGYVIVEPEVWAFQNCGSAVLISVDVRGNEPGFEKLDVALHDAMGCAEDPPGTWTCSLQTAAVYASMTATISPPGHYGHLGKYERQLEMLEIHEATSTAPVGCERPDPRQDTRRHRRSAALTDR